MPQLILEGARVGGEATSTFEARTGLRVQCSTLISHTPLATKTHDGQDGNTPDKLKGNLLDIVPVGAPIMCSTAIALINGFHASATNNTSFEGAVPPSAT